jgi:hypothetical protein
MHMGKEVIGSEDVAQGRDSRTCQAGRAWLTWHVGSISPLDVYMPIKIATKLVELY